MPAAAADAVTPTPAACPLRTHRYYKKFAIPDMDRMNLALEAGCLTMAHANNTLIITVRRRWPGNVALLTAIGDGGRGSTRSRRRSWPSTPSSRCVSRRRQWSRWSTHRALAVRTAQKQRRGMKGAKEGDVDCKTQ